MNELWSLAQDAMDVGGIIIFLALLAMLGFAVLRASAGVVQSVANGANRASGSGKASSGRKGKGASGSSGRGGGGRGGGRGSGGGGRGSGGGGGLGRTLKGAGEGVGAVLGGLGGTLKGAGEGLGGLGKGLGYVADGLGKAGKNLSSGVGTLAEKVAFPIAGAVGNAGKAAVRGGVEGAKKLKEWDDRKQEEKREREEREAQSKAERETRQREWEEERRRMREEREAQNGHQQQVIDHQPTHQPTNPLNATRWPVSDENGPYVANMLARGGVRFAISEDDDGQNYIVINDEDSEAFRECLSANEIELDEAGERCLYEEEDEIDNAAIVQEVQQDEVQVQQDEVQVQQDEQVCKNCYGYGCVICDPQKLTCDQCAGSGCDACDEVGWTIV